MRTRLPGCFLRRRPARLPMAWKRAAELALVCCVAACPIAILGDDRIATDRFRARSLTYPYDEGAIWAMPGEKIPLAVTAPATRLHRIDAPHGGLIATGPNKCCLL